jgi:nucleoside-diphosphate-sugar epimerase
MRIIVLGGDGYLGWPTAMHLAARGHEVWALDNYLRRQIALETCSEPLIPTPQPHRPGADLPDPDRAEDPCRHRRLHRSHRDG